MIHHNESSSIVTKPHLNSHPPSCYINIPPKHHTFQEKKEQHTKRWNNGFQRIQKCQPGPHLPTKKCPPLQTTNKFPPWTFDHDALQCPCIHRSQFFGRPKNFPPTKRGRPPPPEAFLRIFHNPPGGPTKKSEPTTPNWVSGTKVRTPGEVMIQFRDQSILHPFINLGWSPLIPTTTKILGTEKQIHRFAKKVTFTRRIARCRLEAKKKGGIG